jgi:hypothetical protein
MTSTPRCSAEPSGATRRTRSSIKRQRRYAQTWQGQVEQAQQKVQQAEALRQQRAEKAVA